MGNLTLSSVVDAFLQAGNKAAMRNAIDLGKTINNIVYLSSKATLDSDLDSGGGTDATAAIQAVLDTPTASSPLFLIWDGVALTSATLVLKSYTHIYSLPKCGFFLADSSNCHALTNELSGSSITGVDITIDGLTVNANGPGQSKYQRGIDLDSYTATNGHTTNLSTTISYDADPGYGTDYARVVRGMAITGTNIPANTVIDHASSNTTAVISQAATGTGTGISFSMVSGWVDRVTNLNYGIQFSGFQNVHLRNVLLRNSRTFSFVFANGSDFTVRDCRSLWDNNLGPVTLGTGVTNGSATITYADDPGFGTAKAFVRVGGYVKGTDIPDGTYVGSVIDKNSCTLVDFSGTPVNASGSATGITFTFIPNANDTNNEDGLHFNSPLTRGHVDGYRHNGDDDPIAFDTDEGIQYNDSRRGNVGGGTTDIVVENVFVDNSPNAVRIFGSNGTGFVDRITLRNIYGNIQTGNMNCSPATVSGTTYYGRYPADEALVSVGDVTIDGWRVTAVGTNIASNTIKVLNAKLLRLVGIPDSVAITNTGTQEYECPRSPWMSRDVMQPLGISALQSTANGGAVLANNGLDLWAGTSANGYAAAAIRSALRDMPGQGAGVVDWGQPTDIEVTFNVSNPDANTIFRALFGRLPSELSSGGTLNYPGIGLSVENLELYLIAHDATTATRVDTGAALTAAQNARVRLHSRGNGIIDVYVNDVWEYTSGAIGPSSAGSVTVDANFYSQHGATAPGLYVSVLNLRTKQ